MNIGFVQASHRKKLAMLLAALLLLGNSLVTAHVFGEPAHVAADNCDLLHQFERQHQAPIVAEPPSSAPGSAVCPALEIQHRAATATVAVYQSRAPPFA